MQGHSLIKMTGEQYDIPRLLSRAAQRLNLLPRVDTASHFYALWQTCNLNPKALEQTQNLVLKP